MRVRDTSGTYYWHIPTGTTQWEPPSPLGKVGDSMMSSTMSLETTPCEEPEVRSNGNLAWGEATTCKSVDTDIFCWIFQESWTQLSSTEEGAEGEGEGEGEGELWKVRSGKGYAKWIYTNVHVLLTTNHLRNFFFFNISTQLLSRQKVLWEQLYDVCQVDVYLK